MVDSHPNLPDFDRQTAVQKLLDPRPNRKLLAIDGGGVRAGFSIGILSRIERVLREQTKRPQLVLADWFDFIGGTSIGAILAAGLSKGMGVEAIRNFSVDNLHRFFRPARTWLRYRYKYSDEGLRQCLRQTFGDVELGSPELRTLLMIVLRNATTDSPWLVTNNPLAKYNDLSREDSNFRLPLWQLLRGSAAAPTYFPCETIQLQQTQFQFVDGAGTIANNPSMQLFLQATLPMYKLGWPTGTDKMLLISVGTGYIPTSNTAEANLVSNAIAQIRCLLTGAAVEQDLLCRIFGNCVVGDPIDREIGDLIGTSTVWPKQFTYCRYNVEFSESGLEPFGYCNAARCLHRLDDTSNFADLLSLGERVGATRVLPEHFERFV